jgi:hypothetical protein
MISNTFEENEVKEKFLPPLVLAKFYKSLTSLFKTLSTIPMA